MKLIIGDFSTQIQLDPNEVTLHCGLGTNNCCIFFTIGANGPSCERWNSGMASLILDRYERGEMDATRKGCATVNNLDIQEAFKSADENGVVFAFPDLFKE